MDAANKMLSNQFQHLLGLQSTLLVQTDEFAQTDLDNTGGYLPEGTVMVCVTLSGVFHWNAFFSA